MNGKVSLRAFTAALTLTTMLGGVATEAFAQIEEIVVTTRKRAENLQEVPIVVTAFSAESIERKGIADLDDIAKYTSGVMFDTGFGKQDTRVVIRGLSPTRGRQNVAILQDEVDISSLAQGTAGGSFVINPRLQDVERIEVVKGPHPALFGRAAFSGAISYISRQPGDEFRGNAQIDVGTYEKAEARVGISGPVVEGKLSMGLNASVWNEGGFYDSAVTGKGLGGGDGWGTAVSAKFTPNDMVKFNLRTEYSKDYFDPEARFVTVPAEQPIPAQAFTGAGTLAPVINGTIATNRTFPQVVGSLGNADMYPTPAPSRNPRTGEDYPGSERKIFRNTLRAEVETDAVLFTSISHYGDNSTFQYNDAHGFGDYASLAVSAGQESYFETDIRLLSQELRLQSNGDDDFKWTVGGLFWNEKLDQATRNLICVAGSGQCAQVFASYNGPPLTTIKRDTYHYSGYGLFEYNVTDKLSVDVEVRYTVEKEDTSGFATVGADISPGVITPTSIPTTVTSFLGCPGALPSRVVNANGTLSCATAGALRLGTTNPIKQVPNSYTQATIGSVYWAPRFTIDYKATDDALIYASAALGKKPGGLSPLSGVGAVATNTYDPESMWVYEVGAKTEWLDGRMQLNGAVYYQDYSKKQVSITFENPLSSPPNQLTTRVVNAASASVKGLEIDALFAPTDFFTGTVSYTYNDGEYEDFKDISNTASVISRASVRNGGNCTVVAVGTPPASRCIVDYSGYRLEGASKHSIQLGGQVRGDVSAELGWFFDTDVRYQSKRYTSFENSLSMDSYWLVDLRAGLKTETWNVTAYVNNVFNDDTIKASAVYLQAWTASYQPPRPTSLYSFASGLFPDKRQFGVRASVNF